MTSTYKQLIQTLAYFDFYTDSSFSNKITLPLTLLKNKNYKFIQPNYMLDIFKFYLYINEPSSNYFFNLDTTNHFDTDIITKQTYSGITKYNSFIYATSLLFWYSLYIIKFIYRTKYC